MSPTRRSSNVLAGTTVKSVGSNVSAVSDISVVEFILSSFSFLFFESRSVDQAKIATHFRPLFLLITSSERVRTILRPFLRFSSRVPRHFSGRAPVIRRSPGQAAATHPKACRRFRDQGHRRHSRPFSS